MKDFTENLHEELLLRLEDLDKTYDPRTLADTRLDLIVTAIEQIKQKLKPYRFSSAEDEIHYFKNVLPETLALHIYYSDRIEWDRIRALGSSECRYKFIDRIYSQAESFRKENQLFCDYCRDGKTDLDSLYFLRNSPINRETKYQLRQITDPSSPPLHCGILATLIAFTKMEHELKISIAENNAEVPSLKSGKRKHRWTGKKIDLIELGYGLKEMGSIDDGQASLKDIFDFLGEVLEVDPGNTSRLFQDIVTRKAGYTIYLDTMREKLRQRINDMLN
ncbi:MAG: RteC domain-containing protein [Bacteroidota bacterium]|nr:RteC domain-containing protein [Bacteroidota bacterium]